MTYTVEEKSLNEKTKHNKQGTRYVLGFPPVALQSLKDLGRLTYMRFLELFRHMVGLLGRVISPSQGHYLHRTTQHRKTRTNIHALSGIRTHDPSNQRAKTPRLRPHGHCDRHVLGLRRIIPVPCIVTLNSVKVDQIDGKTDGRTYEIH
jgi:hypothetical protein